MAQDKDNTVNQSQTTLRPCPQDCRMCPMTQQIFCSTKMLFDLSRSQQAMAMQMTKLIEAVNELQQKQDADQLSIPFSE